ncbi:MAG: tetratricopeptide repeat protein, partial [Bacteroidetes bacterium]|nr:tetratricopeptide repeat protein [Bacteroidota bacterium]
QPSRKGKSPTKQPLQKTSVKVKPPKGNKRIERICLFAILFITALVFSPTLKNGFIETWDDGVYVTDNLIITNLSANNLQQMWTTPVNGTYVPIPLLSFALEYHYFKLNPVPYHVNNLILHLLCVLLVFLILRLLKLNLVYVVFGTLLFGIHPMRVESVAWVTERKDLLFSLFYLSSLLSYIYYIVNEKGRRKFYLLAAIFFVLSLFSKIQAVTLPLSMLLLDYYFNRPLKLTLIWEKLPHFLLALIFGVAGIFILRKSGSLDINQAYSFVERFFFGMYSLANYLVKLIFPSPLSVYYPYPVGPGKPLPLICYLTPLFLLGLAYLVFLTRKISRAVIFGSVFFLFNIMFLLQILGAGQAYMADRFTYIPYIGLFFLAAWAAQHFSEKYRSMRNVIIVVMGLISIVFIIAASERCRVWKDSETLWTDVIEKYPERIATSYANRASFYRKTNQWPKSLEDYNIAIRLDPTDGTYWMNRGNLFFDSGKDPEAYSDYRVALKNKRLGTDRNRLYANLGAIFGKREKYDSALYYLDLSIKTDSLFPVAFMNRALVFEKSRQPDKAIADYRHYLAFKPDDDRIYSSIGINYQVKQDYKGSIPWFSDAILRNPQAGVYYYNRSISYKMMGDKSRAVEDAHKAEALGYQVPQAYFDALTGSAKP